MEYVEKVNDYIKRANKNLLFVEEAYKKGEDVYEFTQLLSVFVFSLVLYNENIYLDTNPIRFHGFECEVLGNNTYPYDFRKNTYQFINHLRNACCHEGVTIESIDKQIEYVIFTDEKYLYENNIKKELLNKVNIKLNKEQIKKIFEYLVENVELLKRK